MRLFKILGVALLLSSCATSYSGEGFGGGYSETQLAENVFTVRFRGNGYTSRERAADFALLRSAELALANGFKYFVIVDSDSYTKVNTHVTPSTSHTSTTAVTTGSAYSSGNYIYGSAHTSANSTTVTTGGDVYTVTKPRASNTIVCFKEKPENSYAYSAEITYASLVKKYDIEVNVD